MARIEFPGAVYHVSSRGRNRQAIFITDDDRDHFLGLLGSAADRYGFIIHAYCLMDNHYHLLVETPKANLSSGMQFLNSSYFRYFKKKHRNLSSLFGGPYNAVLIKTDSYFVETARYIVLNPVSAKVVRGPGDFNWSNYRATSGSEEVPVWLSVRRIIGSFSKYAKPGQRSYIKYVAEGMKEREMEMFSGLDPFDQ